MPKLIQNNEFISGSPLMDSTPQPNSTHAVQSGGVYTAFNNLSTEISAINSTLANLGVAQTLQISTTHEIQRNNYTRIGNMVVFDILIVAKSRISAWSTFATIPLSPLSNSAYPAANIGNSPATVYVGNNGQIQPLSAVEEGTYIFINGSILVK